MPQVFAAHQGGVISWREHAILVENIGTETVRMGKEYTGDLCSFLLTGVAIKKSSALNKSMLLRRRALLDSSGYFKGCWAAWAGEGRKVRGRTPGSQATVEDNLSHIHISALGQMCLKASGLCTVPLMGHQFPQKSHTYFPSFIPGKTSDLLMLPTIQCYFHSLANWGVVDDL